MDTAKKYCLECKGTDCVRDHLPTRQINDGHRKVLAACAKCGLTKRIMVRYDKDGVAEDLICASCRGVERKKAYGTCGICGKHSAIWLRRDDGIAVGRCCYHRPVEKCYLCKLPRKVKFRLEGKYPICPKCYMKTYVPKFLCSSCGKERPVAKLVEGKPVCYRCYIKNNVAKFLCSSCGKERPVAKWVENKPVCHHCYMQKHAAKHVCVDCKETKLVVKWLDGRGGNRPICQKCYHQRRVKKEIKEESLDI